MSQVRRARDDPMQAVHAVPRHDENEKHSLVEAVIVSKLKDDDARRSVGGH